MRTSPRRIAAAVVLLGPVLASTADDAESTASLVRSFEAKAYPEVLAAAPAVRQSLERDGVWLAAMALEKGPDAAKALSAQLKLPSDELGRALMAATVRCMAVRRYEAAAALFTAVMMDVPGERDRKYREQYGVQLAALFASLRRREDLAIPLSDPRSPVIAVMGFSEGLAGDPGRVYAKDFGSVPTNLTQPLEAAFPDFTELRIKGLVFPSEAKLDMVLAASDFSTKGDPASAWRVLVTQPLVGGQGSEYFVVLEESETRLLGIGRPGPLMLQGLGLRARKLIDADDLASARQLIIWARESVARSNEARWSSFRVASDPEALASVEGLQQAAEALAATAVQATSADGTTRPVLRWSPNGKPSPDFPPAELVGGLIIVKCTITEEGRAEGCTILKGLTPGMNRSVLDWLAGSRYWPATLHNRPVRVSYVFNVKVRGRSL
jgi:hypothetical protein